VAREIRTKPSGLCQSGLRMSHVPTVAWTKGDRFALGRLGSFFCPLEEGRTYLAGISLASWPSDVSLRLRWCAPTQASMPIRHGGRLESRTSMVNDQHNLPLERHAVAPVDFAAPMAAACRTPTGCPRLTHKLETDLLVISAFFAHCLHWQVQCCSKCVTHDLRHSHRDAVAGRRFHHAYGRFPGLR
jgi:hypothetical protein